MSDLKKRIPYDEWINSQLSIARHYGGCVINGKRYNLDFDNAETRIDPETGEEKCFPDLVCMEGDDVSE